MNLCQGSKLASLQKSAVFKGIGVGSWFKNILKRSILGTASASEAKKRELVQKTSYQFRFINDEHDFEYNKPLFALWLLNNFEGRLIKGSSDLEVQDIKEARHKLEEYTKLHTLMQYACTITDRACLLMAREGTNNESVALSVYRGSKHNTIEELFPEIEATFAAYYDLLDQIKENKEWHKKIEDEAGAQIAFLATTLDETSRDYLAEHSESFKRFDMDKQKFFK